MADYTWYSLTEILAVIALHTYDYKCGSLSQKKTIAFSTARYTTPLSYAIIAFFYLPPQVTSLLSDSEYNWLSPQDTETH